jgi:hypothetical protein
MNLRLSGAVHHLKKKGKTIFATRRAISIHGTLKCDQIAQAMCSGKLSPSNPVIGTDLRRRMLNLPLPLSHSLPVDHDPVFLHCFEEDTFELRDSNGELSLYVYKRNTIYFV